MSFVYAKYLPVVAVCIAVLMLLLYRWEKKYFTWIKRYWFFSRTITSKLSSLFLIFGMGLLLFSLLDLRGKEEKISAGIPDQKTIILIDTSSSMLVEDVRPNRFAKSTMLARHFVKKAVGHQFSILIFSDIVQQVSPFSDDIDFLDAKLSALAFMDIKRGGSNIIQAINESVQYLRGATSGKNPVGNIIVFTDSEDNGDMKKLNVPSGVNLAMVGVGTVSGGKIPVKNKRGDFLYFKKYKGQEVVSKLSESTLKEFSSAAKSYKYWVALSYSLPTKDIVNFFRENFKKQLQQGEVRIRPVLANYLMIPAVVLLILSYILGQFKTFTVALLLSFIMLGGQGVSSTYAEEKLEQKKPPTPEELIAKEPLYKKFMAGHANRSEKLKLAERMLKVGGVKQSITLYDELMTEREDDEVYFNYGTALLKDMQIQKGMKVLNGLKPSLEMSGNDDLLAKLRKNIAATFIEEKKEKKKQEQKKDKKKEKKKEQKKEDKKDKKKGSQSKKQKKDKKDPDTKDKKKQEEKKKEQQKKDKNKEQDQKDQKSGDTKESKKRPKKDPLKKKAKPQNFKNLKQKEDEIKKKRKLKKVPGIIKQIMDDDKNIMKKYLDTTHEKGSSDKKDW